MADIIGYTFFALYIFFQFWLGTWFLVWGLEIGLPFFLYGIPALILGGNCVCGIYMELTDNTSKH